jgi:N-acetylmuramoyl-L-alanine amidase
LTILQEENLNNSIILATEIQDNFTNNLKKFRGIKQQPLWVLDAVYMPSVLIELGFYQIRGRRVFKLRRRTRSNGIANRQCNCCCLKKKKYLGTGWGVDKTAKNRKTTLKNNISSNNNETVYKVQLLAASKKYL